MPFEYLREIADAPLPVTVTDEARIDKLRVLRAAELVVVMLPRVDAQEQFARVLSLTPRGRAVLECSDVTTMAGELMPAEGTGFAMPRSRRGTDA